MTLNNCRKEAMGLKDKKKSIWGLALVIVPAILKIALSFYGVDIGFLDGIDLTGVADIAMAGIQTTGGVMIASSDKLKI